MAVDDDDLLAAITRHLVGGFLKQRKLQIAAIGDGAGLVASFGNLPEIVFGEDDSIFFLGGVKRCITNVQQVGAQRQMRSMLLKNAERQQACALCTMDSLAEIRGGEFLPVNRKLDGGVTACAWASEAT